MNCVEIKETLSSYLDDELSLPARSACDEHLRHCPVCREELELTRSLVRGLSGLSRPAPPPDLIASINDALMIEAGAVLRQPRLSFNVRLMRWLRPRVMPYTVGTFASCLLFILMFTALRSSLMAFRSFDRATRSTLTEYRINYVQGADEGYDITKPITPETLAARRASVGVESPSLNPNGALAALVWAPGRDKRAGDDDMVVVTDVFSNGRASLADVVQPPRNRRLLDEFQNALREGPAFVPASYDKRPQTMRVVFVLQKVSVREGDF